ncbi:hypothetical protein [Micromonospora radicis]|uniref:Uncharacterized protein n=1 Tax=Micromonospora radicis TaxID=1894971 RepID=A0A418MR33_9ACTN|nr:hypothetical protein [Micromonospora radicis]RIV36116.1 hypothetical protein D2L64_20070 [Micromonospora radicis]
MPAPALPVWPPPTSPVGRRDEPSPASPGAAPRQSARPGLVPPAPPGPAPTRAAPPPPTPRTAPTQQPGGGPGDRQGTPTGRPEQAAKRPDGAGLSAYYSSDANNATVAFPAGEPENSGSLTGHILAQGWTESSAERSSSTLRVMIVMAVALCLLVAISVLVVLVANDALSGLTGGQAG